MNQTKQNKKKLFCMRNAKKVHTKDRDKNGNKQTKQKQNYHINNSYVSIHSIKAVTKIN